MKPKQESSQKHQAVNKNNRRTTYVIVAASSLFVFMLVGGHSMLNRMSYQRKVTAKQGQAIDTLKADQTALNTLVNQYKVFNSANPNLLGVNNSGSAGDQGSNARIVLDALPSQYDFPALASSIEKVMLGRGVTPQGISGADTSQTNVAPDNTEQNPKPVPINFTFTEVSNYQTSLALLNDFQRSIRPFKVVTLDISGGNSAMTLAATLQTYFQTGKKLNITDQLVKQ